MNESRHEDSREERDHVRANASGEMNRFNVVAAFKQGDMMAINGIMFRIRSTAGGELTLRPVIENGSTLDAKAWLERVTEKRHNPTAPGYISATEEKER